MNRSRGSSWIEISDTRLAANFRAIEAAAGDATTVLCVIKANAYGHGAERCAPVLARAGAQWLGVTHAEEGVRVRKALGEANPQILVMSGFLPGDVADLVNHRLTPVLWTAEHIRWLAGTGLPVHMEVDTGMGRQGVLPGPDFARLLGELRDAGLTIDGVFTHFCSSEVAGSPLTQMQERRFEQAIAQARAAGITPRWVHAGNTSAVDNPAQEWPWLVDLAATVGARALVRTGLALYGHCLEIEGDGQPRVEPALRPVMSWKAAVLAVRELGVGETVGYNATFIAPRSMRVALLPVGYADGLRRELSSSNLPGREHGGGWVMLRGRRAPILGRVSMNLTVVDVSELDGVAAGDEAVLLGDGITAADHARLAGTIPYEILCGVKPT